MRTASLAASLLLASSTLAIAGQPQTLQVCGNDQIPLSTTNWTDSVAVPKFDPALGILVSVDFELKGNILGSAAVESLDAAPSTVTTDYQAAITLTRPDLSVIVVAIPQQQFIDNLTAFDGTIDFGGTSGATHGNISTNATQTVNSSAPADLALFTGLAGNPGQIILPVSAAGSSVASGAGNLLAQFQTSAGAEVRVCYNYVLDCDQNGIPDDQDIQQGAKDLNQDGIPDRCQPGWVSFCEGDGSQNGGADCPCQNNGGPGEGCDNGSGSGGLLAASGTPSIANDSLVLTASQIPGNAPGFFFYGTVPSNGGNGVVFANGLRCIDQPVPIRKVNFGGSIPQGNMPPLSIFVGASAGDTTYFQYWYRNPNGPCLNASANTTNGVAVTWGL